MYKNINFNSQFDELKGKQGLFFTSFDIYYPGHKLIWNTDQLEQTNNASDSWYLCDLVNSHGNHPLVSPNWPELSPGIVLFLVD